MSPKTSSTHATVHIFISIIFLSSPIKKDLMPPPPQKKKKNRQKIIPTQPTPSSSQAHQKSSRTNQPRKTCPISIFSKDGHWRLLSSTSFLFATLESCTRTFPRDGGGSLKPSHVTWWDGFGTTQKIGRMAWVFLLKQGRKSIKSKVGVYDESLYNLDVFESTTFSIVFFCMTSLIDVLEMFEFEKTSDMMPMVRTIRNPQGDQTTIVRHPQSLYHWWLKVRGLIFFV